MAGGWRIAFQLRGKVQRILFRHDGKQHISPLGPVSEREAEAESAQVDHFLLRLKQRLIDLPPGVGIVAFVRFDGSPPSRVTKDAPPTLALGELRDRFLAAREGGREASTQVTTAIHFRQSPFQRSRLPKRLTHATARPRHYPNRRPRSTSLPEPHRIEVATEVSPLTVLARGVLQWARTDSFFNDAFDLTRRSRR